MKYLFVLILLISVLKINAATGSREDDVLIYGGSIIILLLIIGIIYLVAYIKKRIREYKKTVTEES